MTASADGLNSKNASFDDPGINLRYANNNQPENAFCTEAEQHSTQTDNTEMIDNTVGEWLW